MKKRLSRGLSTLLLLFAVLCAYYAREQSVQSRTQLPVTRVFAFVPAATPSPAPSEVYRARRDAQRRQEYAALNERIRSGDESAAAAHDQLLRQAEAELAVEAALSGLGYPHALCAIRGDAVNVSVGAPLSAAQALSVITLIENITGKSAENVFMLD